MRTEKGLRKVLVEDEKGINMQIAEGGRTARNNAEKERIGRDLLLKLN